MRVGCVVVGVVLVCVAAGGVAVWSHQTRIHPVKAARDAMTSYQSGSDRHRLAQPLDRPWDPVGDANARVAAVPPDERAYPLLAEMAARLRAASPPRGVLARPGEPGWDEAAEWARGEDVRAIVGLVEQAAGKPRLGMPLGVEEDQTLVDARRALGQDAGPVGPPADRPLLIDVVQPVTGSLRGSTNIMLFKAELARLEDDRELFARHISTALSLAQHRSELNMLIEQMVRDAIIVAVARRVAVTLRDHPGFLDEATSDRIEQALAGAANLLGLDTTAERLSVEDFIRRLVDDHGVYSPALTAQSAQALGGAGGAWTPPSSVRPEHLNADLAEVLEASNTWAVNAEKAAAIPWTPVDPDPETKERFLRQRSSLPGLQGRLALGIMAPSWSRVVSVDRSVRADLTGLRVALAAHRHHLRHGEPPASLDAIDADLLAFEPVDGFTGGRLVYRWTGEGHLVYALGADGVDRGGRHAVGPDGEPVRLISDEYLRGKWDGDWVVFPPRE